MPQSLPSSLRVMRVHREQEGPRVTAAPRHFDPTNLGTEACASQPDVWIDACRAAGLLINNTPALTPASPTTNDDDDDNPDDDEKGGAPAQPVETSTVAVYTKRASRFPMVPVACGRQTSTDSERTWVGLPYTGPDGADVFVTHYGRLMDQILEEVAPSATGEPLGSKSQPAKAPSRHRTWTKATKRVAPKVPAKVPAHVARRRQKGFVDSDSDMGFNLFGSDSD